MSVPAPGHFRGVSELGSGLWSAEITSNDWYVSERE